MQLSPWNDVSRTPPPPVNVGFAGANTKGLKHTSGRYIFLLNNDVELHKDCLHHLLAAMEGNPAVGICASKMIVHGSTAIDSAGDGFGTNLKGFKRGEGRPVSLYDKQEYIFGACAGAALYRRMYIYQ